MGTKRNMSRGSDETPDAYSRISFWAIRCRLARATRLSSSYSTNMALCGEPYALTVRKFFVWVLQARSSWSRLMSSTGNAMPL